MPRYSEEVRNLLAKAKESALLAVDVYNRPTASFRSGSYIVLMQIAWTAAFLGHFLRKGTKPYFRQANGRYVRLDGQPKAWDLQKCCEQFWGSQDNAVWQNLRFFMGLRNRIEHRDLPGLDVEIFGECQAMLFNLEEFLSSEFGVSAGLNQRLAFSLQFSKTLTVEQNQSLKTLTRPLAANVKEYLDRFRSSLSDSEFGDPQFSQRYFLLPNLGNHLSRDTVAIQWIPYDEADPESMKVYETVAAIVKIRHVPVANTEGMKPSQVIETVAAALFPKRFNSHHHIQAWKYFKVRPETGSSHPEVCNTKYCHYDKVHKDYVYTMAWVQKLMSELEDEVTYLAVCSYGKPGEQAVLQSASTK